jgi:hypothetical protein
MHQPVAAATATARHLPNLRMLAAHEAVVITRKLLLLNGHLTCILAGVALWHIRRGAAAAAAGAAQELWEGKERARHL